MADFRPPPRIKNALDNRKLNLSAPTPGAQGKYANLIWGIINNNPRITVYTGDPSEEGNASKGYGKIDARLGIPVFYALFECVEKAIAFVPTDAVPEYKIKVENKNFTFPGGKRSEKPEVVSEIFIGKDKDGVVWISITARDRPRIKFPFAPSNFHNFVHGDGSSFTAAETSEIFARAYIGVLRSIVAHLAVTLYVEPEKKDNGGNRGGPSGGQGGGYSNRGGGQGGGGGGGGGNTGGGQPDAGFDNDLPF